MESLRVSDATRLSNEQLVAAAQRNGVEENVLRAIQTVESAGPGFASDGRPLISFEPYWFSQTTGGRFDASHPAISNGASRAYLGGGQASRWTRLAEAYALDPDAALGATSWGVFQLPGRYFDDAGYANVFLFVQDMAQSETRQLAAFEAYAQRKELIDELQSRDWAAFAAAFEGDANAANYAQALARAYATLTAANDPYLASLRAQDPRPLTREDYAAVAAELGCEPEAIQAVAAVESGRQGAFDANGRVTILFEPHKFSGFTNRQYDVSHPNISYRSWDPTRYPRTQDGCWAQLREAYALNPEAAIKSASWGLLQIMGFNYQPCGFASARELVTDMARSQVQQLRAFVNFVRSNNLVGALVAKDWAAFAAGYNGTGQVEYYSSRMQSEYNRLKGT